MTITTLILLLATGILAVTAECQKENAPIKTCCCLGFNTFSIFNKRKSGVYTMMNFCGAKCNDAEVYCDTSNGGGGWLVVQRRQDGSIDFNRTWMEYEDGFGKLTGEFWYGLRALHCLTGQGGWEMRMDIELANGTNIFLQYEWFKVASAKDKYKLTVGRFQGTTTNPMVSHNKMYFTTKDSDNDKRDSSNCALHDSTQPSGGWWHSNCWGINPNNYYNRFNGVHINKKWHSIPFIEMKIRPYNCNI